jgi:hypothetical protein
MDARIRQLIAFHVDDRIRKSARKLGGKIPKAYRQQATFYTDQYVAYEGGDSRYSAPSHQQKSAQDQSYRVLQ